MGIITRVLLKYAEGYGIALTNEMLDKFEIYAETLLKYNQRINLTAITKPEEIAVKHFLDSILILKAVDVPQGATLIDVGTGAGFPGVPLKIVRPDLRVTLLDSLRKRISFLVELSHALGQENTMIHGRAEELARTAELRDGFDFSTARAVAALSALCEYCVPFVKAGGIFIALKGSDVEQEVVGASCALSLLCSEISDIKLFDLPPDSKRGIVLIRKISQTPPKYPRNAVKITKTPL